VPEFNEAILSIITTNSGTTHRTEKIIYLCMIFTSPVGQRHVFFLALTYYPVVVIIKHGNVREHSCIACLVDKNTMFSRESHSPICMGIIRHTFLFEPMGRR
jgi:hypothetical protein